MQGMMVLLVPFKVILSLRPAGGERERETENGGREGRKVRVRCTGEVVF